MMDEISVDTPCDVPEKLIVSDGGAHSADLNAVGFYF